MDEISIDAIAIAQLDEEVRQDVKMLQLAGNKSLERLWNPLFSNYVQVSAAEHSRLNKTESLIESWQLRSTACRQHQRHALLVLRVVNLIIRKIIVLN